MKEMIEKLIADGWEWVAVDNNKRKNVFLYVSKPILGEISENIFSCSDEKSSQPIPSCLFPDITFENSPVELKTLLVDEEEESEGEHHKIVQKEIASLLEKNYSFLIRDFEEDVIAVAEDVKSVEYNVSCFLSKLCPDKYEKVYLKDLVKKRKVKKTLYLKKHCGVVKIIDDENDMSYCSFSDIGFNLLKNTSCIELTYEVEE